MDTQIASANTKCTLKKKERNNKMTTENHNMNSIISIIHCITLALNLLEEDTTSDSGREFQMFTVRGTGELWKAFVRAKGWWRRYCLLVRWQKLDHCETMSGGKKHRPCTLLYNVYMLECSLLNSREGMLTILSRSWYPVSHRLVITLMAYFSTSSTALTSLRM